MHDRCLINLGADGRSGARLERGFWWADGQPQGFEVCEQGWTVREDGAY